MNGITFPIHLYSEQAQHQAPLLSGTPKILTQSGDSEAKWESSGGETSVIQSIK